MGRYVYTVVSSLSYINCTVLPVLLIAVGTIDVYIRIILLSWLVAMHCGCKHLQSVVGVSSVNFHLGMWSCLLASNLSLLQVMLLRGGGSLRCINAYSLSSSLHLSNLIYSLHFCHTNSTAWSLDFQPSSQQRRLIYCYKHCLFLCVTIREHRFFYISIKFNVCCTHYR